MVFWGNLIGYQLVWFSVVWSAGRGQPWMGMLACSIFVAWQLFASAGRNADLRVLGAGLLCGALIEGTLAALGLLAYASPAPTLPGWPAPLWIVFLWGAFAMTLNHSMAWFASRPWLAALFAGFGAPAAYLGAARGFAAVTFSQPTWPALAALALAWALALPLLLWIGSRHTHIEKEARA